MLAANRSLKASQFALCARATGAAAASTNNAHAGGQRRFDMHVTALRMPASAPAVIHPVIATVLPTCRCADSEPTVTAGTRPYPRSRAAGRPHSRGGGGYDGAA